MRDYRRRGPHHGGRVQGADGGGTVNHRHRRGERSRLGSDRGQHHRRERRTRGRLTLSLRRHNGGGCQGSFPIDVRNLVRVVVEGVPDSPVLLVAILHLLADKGVDAVDGAPDMLNLLTDGLAMLDALRPLLRQHFLEALARCTLPLCMLMVGLMMLLPNSPLLVQHVMQVRDRILSGGALALQHLMVRTQLLLAQFLLTGNHLMDLLVVPLADALLV
mmetsp:Transcript_87367/g.251931  ORF Transcript_87367/g.251931 Transcript_87367/m.251931 type:complete len:218 (-) Transcript_87367:3795-4448(-)